jgi:hypothetical protein
MKIALTTNRDLLPGSQGLKTIVVKLKEFTSLYQPIYIFTPRITGQESFESDFPFYVSYPYLDLNQGRVNLIESVENIVKFIREFGYENIYLYGAGMHTRKLLALFSELGFIDIRGLLISSGEEGILHGISVYLVDKIEFNETEKNLVVFSSECFEGNMYETFKTYCPTVSCVALYNANYSYLDKSESEWYLEYYKDSVVCREDLLINYLNLFEPDIVLLCDEDDASIFDSLNYKPKMVLSVSDFILNPISLESFRCQSKILDERPKFIFYDQCLRTENGHYLHYAKNVLIPAAEHYETYLICKQRIEVKSDFVNNVIPILRFDAWGGDIPSLYAPNHEVCAYNSLGKLISVVKAMSLNEDDHIFIPNVFDYELDILIEKLHEIKSEKFQLHLLFRYDIYPDFDRLSRMQMIFGLYKNVHFHTDTEQLRLSHTVLGNYDMNVMPIPVVCKSTDFHLNLRSSCRRVVSLGIGRCVKGFQHLPRLIEEFYALNPESEVVFEIQNFTDDPDPIASETVAKLEKMKETYPLVLHSGPLSQSDYQQMVDAADVFICLYDPIVYRERSSHIVSEALCYGKAVLITRGCAPASLLDSNCPWIVNDPTKASSALTWIVWNWEESLKFSRKYSAQYAALFTGEKLGDYFKRI